MAVILHEVVSRAVALVQKEQEKKPWMVALLSL